MVAFIATISLTATIGAQAQPPANESQRVRADNYYAAGNHIEITAPMPADVIVAGRRIDIVQPVAGDILAAGWRVALSGQADDDVRIAAGEVTIDSRVVGDLTVAGGDVTIGRHTRVSGRTWLTGRTVRIEGVFDRDLQAAGATVEIAGEIRESARIIAERLEILPSARILGPLTYQGPSEARIATGATVSGPITFNRISEREVRRERSFRGVSGLLFSAHLFLAGLLVVIFLPRVETSVVGILRAQPGRSLLAGFVLLVTTPVAALLLAGVLTLALLRSLLGGVIVFASVVFGLGALMLSAYQSYSGESAPTPA